MGAPTKSARNWAIAAHCTGLLGLLWPLGFVGPLAVWLLRRRTYDLVDENGKESLNFQLSLIMYLGVAGLTGVLIGPIGFILVAGLYLTIIIGVITASVAAYRGTYYRYPITIRLIK